MSDYILFLDEANAGTGNPYFCLGGIIIKRSVYENDLIRKVNTLKETFFSTTSVIFHYAEMKKNDNVFSSFQETAQRDKFWRAFNSTLKPIDFLTIGTYLNYSDFYKTYKAPKNKHYEVAFIRLMNNYITFLRQNKSMGSVIFESRQWKENADIQAVFNNILAHGTDMYKPEECQKYLSTIGFIIKKENCVGLQIADFVPDSFIRDINSSKNYYNIKDNFINKLVSVSGNYQEIIGLCKIM